MSPVMLDLFSGLGGASSAFREAGWTVYTADINREFDPDFCVDLSTWSFPKNLVRARVDLVWASPPCTYFSRYIQRGVFKNEPLPELGLYQSALRIIQEVNPTWWVIENVRGAVPFFSGVYRSYGSFFLWGNFPDLAVNSSRFHFVKSHVTSGHKRRAADRGCIPHGLSQALLRAVTSYQFLFELPQVNFDRSRVVSSGAGVAPCGVRRV